MDDNFFEEMEERFSKNPFDLVAFNSKYAELSEKEEWFDLHLKRGQELVNDVDFKDGLMTMGVSSEDADGYISMLNDINDAAADLTGDSRMMEMMDVRMKYEDFIDREGELKELINKGVDSDVADWLRINFSMSEDEIETVLIAKKYEMEFEKRDSEEKE